MGYFVDFLKKDSKIVMVIISLFLFVGKVMWKKVEVKKVSRNLLEI